MSRRAETIDLLTQVSRTVRGRTRVALAPLDLSPATARALRTLGRRDGPTRMSDLADALQIGRRSTTDVVEILVARGFLARTPDPHDGRATVVSLTAAGEAVLRRMESQRRRIATEVAAPLDDAEIAQLHRLLAKLIDGHRAGH